MVKKPSLLSGYLTLYGLGLIGSLYKLLLLFWLSDNSSMHDDNDRLTDVDDATPVTLLIATSTSHHC